MVAGAGGGKRFWRKPCLWAKNSNGYTRGPFNRATVCVSAASDR